MSKHYPPMYRKVRKKTTPTRPRRTVTQKPLPQPVKAPEKAESVVAEAPQKEEAKAVPKKTTSSKKTTKKKAAPKSKLLEWDKSMTQKELYRLAKDAGLDVRSRDFKNDIIKTIKKHNRKAKK